MHTLIITFNLNGMSDVEFTDACREKYAPAFATIRGLVSKVWLRNPETNTYGGVYTWQDRQAMEEYRNSELFKALVANPQLANLESMDFSVMEAPSRLTRGLVEIPA